METGGSTGTFGSAVEERRSRIKIGVFYTGGLVSSFGLGNGWQTI